MQGILCARIASAFFFIGLRCIRAKYPLDFVTKLPYGRIIVTKITAHVVGLRDRAFIGVLFDWLVTGQVRNVGSSGQSGRCQANANLLSGFVACLSIRRS